ncbi:MAG: magnesium protoporphyrin IX methyltransferase [Pseudomonadota bacterium]
MQDTSYSETRRKLTTYFDETAAENWARLTSDAPVGRVRATVRAGRDDMRATLLSWLPDDLSGMRVLDAGCGTGALALIAAQRGADVVAVDVSATLVELAGERASAQLAESGGGSIDFRVGDMLDPSLGAFDYVVAMDSLIHYASDDIARTLGQLGDRTRRAMVFTFAPRTPALAMMHMVGRLIPNLQHRAPAIIPVAEQRLISRLGDESTLDPFHVGRGHRVSSGFYKSQAMELARR